MTRSEVEASTRRLYPLSHSAGCTWPPQRADGRPLMPNERHLLAAFLKERDAWHSHVSRDVRERGMRAPAPLLADRHPRGDWQTR